MLKLKNFNLREFLLMLLVVVFAGFGGALVLSPSFWSIGWALLLISFGCEYFLLTQLDTRRDVREIVEEAEEAKEEIESAKREVEDAVYEIAELRNKVFGYDYGLSAFGSISGKVNTLSRVLGRFSHIGGPTVSERLNKLENDNEIIKKHLKNK